MGWEKATEVASKLVLATKRHDYDASAVHNTEVSKLKEELKKGIGKIAASLEGFYEFREEGDNIELHTTNASRHLPKIRAYLNTQAPGFVEVQFYVGSKEQKVQKRRCVRNADGGPGWLPIPEISSISRLKDGVPIQEVAEGILTQIMEHAKKAIIADFWQR